MNLKFSFSEFMTKGKLFYYFILIKPIAIREYVVAFLKPKHLFRRYLIRNSYALSQSDQLYQKCQKLRTKEVQYFKFAILLIIKMTNNQKNKLYIFYFS
jgi:hypothetical protein